jgi:type IV pilus assembly protein PilQ
VIAEPRTNQLFVTDIGSKLEQVQQLISKLDIAVRQVLIEARIVEASDTFGKSLGVRLGGSDLRGLRGGDAGYSIGGANRVALGGTYNAVSGTTLESNTVLDTAQHPVRQPAGRGPGRLQRCHLRHLAVQFSGQPLPESGTVSAGGGRQRQAGIQPAHRHGRPDQGLDRAGNGVPYQQATSSGATAVAFRRATLKLEVTPQITPEGNIILDLDISKDSRGETTAAGIAINTKHIKTQVLVENGGTVVIGGIFELNETENETKVPVLGDLPAVGNLFKTRQRSCGQAGNAGFHHAQNDL